MIVTYGKANTLTLSYVEGEGKTRAVKLFKFVPGENQIKTEVWEKIKETILSRPKGEAQLDHYLTHLNPLEEAGNAPDGSVDYSALNARDLAELIDNTMNLDRLSAIEDYENETDRPRSTVLKAIEKQRKAINDFNEGVAAGSDEA